MKKVIFIVIILAITIGGYFYYTKRILPNNLVSSFCKTLEYDGPKSSGLWELLLSDFEVTPFKSWEEFYTESKEKDSDLSKEKLFQIWERIYINRIKDYVDVSIDYPTVYMMTREVFEEAFSNFSFAHFNIEHKVFHEKFLECTGYVDVKFDRRDLGNQKFTLIAKNGSLGWKVYAFALMDL